jgi:hypothetical protein
VKNGHGLKQRILEPEHDLQRVEDKGLIGRGVRLTAMGLKSQSNRIFDSAAATHEIVRIFAPDLPISPCIALC